MPAWWAGVGRVRGGGGRPVQRRTRRRCRCRQRCCLRRQVRGCCRLLCISCLRSSSTRTRTPLWASGEGLHRGRSSLDRLPRARSQCLWSLILMINQRLRQGGCEGMGVGGGRRGHLVSGGLRRWCRHSRLHVCLGCLLRRCQRRGCLRHRPLLRCCACPSACGCTSLRG